MDEFKNMVYTDQSGKFLVTSKTDNEYFMFMCGIDINAILMEAMKYISENDVGRIPQIEKNVEGRRHHPKKAYY